MQKHYIAKKSDIYIDYRLEIACLIHRRLYNLWGKPPKIYVKIYIFLRHTKKKTLERIVGRKRWI